VPVQKLTDGEAREPYALLLTSAACLREAGFEPSEPPSEQTWIDAYFVGVPWNPYADLVVADIDSVEYAAYFEACPVPSVRAG
jgi:hypothetical protein